MIGVAGDGAAVGKKKRNRGKKKKESDKEEPASTGTVLKGQTNPPTIPIVQLFPDGN